MSYEVVMPQLGMTQDSGVIVKWHKKAGDTVAASDVLMEVETDKAVVEVEAGKAGKIQAILAAENEEVQVGTVVAQIASASSKSAPKAKPAAKSSAPVKTASKSVSAPAAPAAKPASRSKAGSTRILASPKARRASAQRGIDLESLVVQGLAEQPVHFADLENLDSALDVSSPIKRTASDVKLNELLSMPQAATREKMLMAFAADAWRSANGLSADDLINVEFLFGIDKKGYVWPNPDQASTTRPKIASAKAKIHLRLRDLTFAAARGSKGKIANIPSKAPMLTITRNNRKYAFSLSFTQETSERKNMGRFAHLLHERIVQPLHYLM